MSHDHNHFFDKLDGGTRLRFGKFKGYYMKDVPEWYLEFMIDLWDNDCDDEDMREFIDLMKDTIL